MDQDGRLEELQKQLDDVRAALEKLLPGSRAHQTLSKELTDLETQLRGSGAVAQGDGATAIGEDGISVGGNLDGTLIKGEQNQVFRNSTVILAGDGARILVGEHSQEQNSKPNVQAITSFAPTVTSILTFLFTDIVGSTQLWEQQPETMRAALARHDAILREAIESHKGKVFKTVGDAFYSAFPNTRNALKAAIAAQRALHAEAWGETVIKVRMALHTGSVETRDNDYFGPPLNRVARLLSAGHGGQILLSTATKDLLQNQLPEGVDLRDMGERRLKDLARPEHIYQLLVSDLPIDFPPLNTLETIRTNLPTQLTSFIGREKEIAAVKKLISSSRLTSLTGAGGAGKTRLSLQVAADLLDSFPGGVWFVELAPLSDPALIPQTIASALGLREESNRPLLEMLTNYLRAKTALLILDNCEHVIEAAAQFVETMLQSCPNLRLLVSSREALGIAGEAVYRVPSLSTPNPRIAHPLADLATLESVRLFVERAQAASPSFALSQENAPAIAQICSRLDGIPLAIELAAARVKMLRVEQIAERLDDRFRLLTGGSRTALPRHQTLRAMIDWSYDLLPESERALLRRLSVFAGGWTLEAAETVCQGPGIDDYNVFDPLSQLVNKSLVVVDPNEGVETRYRLLETVRQYAREKLTETGEGMSVRDAHLQYFLALAERAEPEELGMRVLEWVNTLEIELDNIRTALEWSLKRDAQVGLRLVCAFAAFWGAGSYFRDARHWLAQLLKRPEVQPHTLLRARALSIQGRWDGSRLIVEESLALCRELDDKSCLAFNLISLGLLTVEEDRAHAQRLFTESLDIYRELGNKSGMTNAFGFLGMIARDMNDYERAYACWQNGLAIAREIEYMFGIRGSLSELCWIAITYGKYAEARRWLDELSSIESQLDKRGLNILTSFALIGDLAYWGEGDYTKARAYFERELSVIKSRGWDERGGTAWVLAQLAYAALRQGDIPYAREVFSESLRQFKNGFPEPSKIGFVYILEGLASLATLQGMNTQAAQCFAYTDTAREALDNPRPLNQQAWVDRDLAIIRTQLDEAAFAEAQAVGRAMSMDEAIALALQSVHD